MTHLQFDPARISVFADDWRQSPLGLVSGKAA
jgi:hypothetical protein